MATKDNAITECKQLRSTLITIADQDEQEFINGFLEPYNKVSDRAWLDLTRSNDKFKAWSDETMLNYTNWSPESARDGSEECADMSLDKETLGLWNDDSCTKKALIVCQKVLDPLLITIADHVDRLENNDKINTGIIADLNKKIDQAQSLVPIGFLYTQYPNQTLPQELWNNYKWQDVTSQYSGLFFRAEGGNSEPFGKYQDANYTKLYFQSNKYWQKQWVETTINGEYSPYIRKEIEKSKWIEINDYPRGMFNQIWGFATETENRPKNTAIKIWKRIG